MANTEFPTTHNSGFPVELATKKQAVTYDGFKSIEDKEAFTRKLMEPLREEHILGQFTEKKKMPKHSGKFMSFRKSARIKPPLDSSGNPVVLEEGKLPAPNSFGILEYRSTLARYGDYIKYSDEAMEYPIDDLHAAIVTEMGYSYKDLMEIMRTKLMLTSLNRWYAGGAASESAITKNGIVLADLPKLSAFFARNNVQPAKDNYYVMLVPPEAIIDLQSLTKSTTEYTYVEIAKDMQSAEVLYRGAEGKLFRFIFVATNSIHAYESGDNTYAKCLVLGKVRGKWGTEEVSLEGENLPQLINKGLDTGGVENALNQVGSIGYKIHGWGGVVTHEEAVAVYTIKLSTDEYAAWDDENRIGAVNKVDFVSGTGTTASSISTSTGAVNGVASE